MLVTLSQIVQRFIQSLRPDSLTGVVQRLSSIKDRISEFLFSRPPSVSPTIRIIPGEDPSTQILEGIVDIGEQGTFFFAEYGTTPAFGFTSSLYSSSTVEGISFYSIEINGLQEDQKYFYRVRSFNGFNNSISSSVDIVSGSFFISEPLRPAPSPLLLFGDPEPLDPYQADGDPVQTQIVSAQLKQATVTSSATIKVYITKQQQPTCDPPAGEEIQITFVDSNSTFCSTGEVIFSSPYFTNSGEYFWLLYGNENRIILTLPNNQARFDGPCIPCTGNIPIGPSPTSTQIATFHKGQNLSFQTEVPYFGWYNGLSDQNTDIGEEPFGNISLNYYQNIGESNIDNVVQATKARMDAEQAIFPNRKFIIDIPTSQMFAKDLETKQIRDQIVSHTGGIYNGDKEYPGTGRYRYSGSQQEYDVPLNTSVYYTSPDGCLPPYDNCDPNFIGTLVNGLKDDDRIIAWYISDEPEVNGFRDCQPRYTAQQCQELFDTEVQRLVQSGSTQQQAQEQANRIVYLGQGSADKYCHSCIEDRTPVTTEQIHSYKFLMDRYNYVKSLDGRPVIAVVAYKTLFGLYDIHSGRGYTDPYTRSSSNPQGLQDSKFQAHRFLKNGEFDPPYFYQIVKNGGATFFDTIAVDPYFFLQRNKPLSQRNGFNTIIEFNPGISEEDARSIRYQSEIDFLKIMAKESSQIQKFFWVSQGADDRQGVPVMSLDEFKLAFQTFLKAKDELKAFNVEPIGYVLWAFDSTWASLETLRRANNSLKLTREWELEYRGFEFLPYSSVNEACNWTGSLPTGSQGRLSTYSNTGDTSVGSYLYADTEGLIPLPNGVYKVNDGFDIVTIGVDSETGFRGKIVSKSRCGDAPTPTPTPTPTVTPTVTPTTTVTPSVTVTPTESPVPAISKSVFATFGSAGTLTICTTDVSLLINLEPRKNTLCDSDYLTDDGLVNSLAIGTEVYFKDKDTLDYIKTVVDVLSGTSTKVYKRDIEYGCRNCVPSSPTPTPTITPTNTVTPSVTPTPGASPTPTPTPTITPTPDAVVQTPSRVFNNGIHTIAVQNDGKILVGGTFTTLGTGGNRVSQNRISRLNNIGSLDTTFNIGTGFTSTTPGAVARVNDIKIQSDGKILVGGIFSSYSGSAVSGLVRLESNGRIEQPLFVSPGVDRFGDVRSIFIQSDGKVIIGGSFESYNNQAVNNLTRLIPTLGAVDNTFDPGFTVNGAVNTIYGDQDGVLVGGGFTGGVRKIGDSSFNENLETGFDGIVHKIIRQPDGKYLVGGNFIFFNPGANNPDNTYQRLRIARLNSNGTLDTTFGFTDSTKGFNEAVLDISLQDDGKIITVGRYVNVDPGTDLGIKFYIARLNSNGTVDNTFAGGFNSWGRCINGNLVGGDFTTFGGINVGNLVRLLANGSQTEPLVPPTPTPTPTVPASPTPTPTPTVTPTPNNDPNRCITYIVQADNGTDVKDPNPYEFFYIPCGDTVQESFTLRNKQRLILCAKADSITVSEEAEGIIGVIPDTDCSSTELDLESIVSDYTNNTCYEYKNLFTKPAGYANSDLDYYDGDYCQTGSLSLWSTRPTFRQILENDILYTDSNCSQPANKGSYSDGTFVLRTAEGLKNFFYFCGTNRGREFLETYTTALNRFPIYGRFTSSPPRLPYASVEDACADGSTVGGTLLSESTIFYSSDNITGNVLKLIPAGTVLFLPSNVQEGYYRLVTSRSQFVKENTSVIYLKPVTGRNFLYTVDICRPCITSPISPVTPVSQPPTLPVKLIPGIKTIYQGFTIR